MGHSKLLASWVGIALLTVVVTSVPAEPRKYQPPRLADGKPDLQGVWSNASLTTLERAAQYKTLVIAPDQIKAVTASHPQFVRQQTDDGLDSSAPLTGADLKSGRGYNAFWIDPGMSFGLVRGEYRTSWIVDPADGRIPYTDSARKTIAALPRENFDGPEARPLGERCIATGGRIGPPMINGLYNNNYQIFQTADYVVISIEMVQHARLIPLNRKHAPAGLRPMFGDSVGWWEGDTLVVETVNFHPLHSESANPAYLSAGAKVTERFSRASKNQILYEFTVEDPTFYQRPWKGELSFNTLAGNLYEYACHEGNYAMFGVLAGARVQEADPKAGKKSVTLSDPAAE